MRCCIPLLLLLTTLHLTSAQEFQEPLYDGTPLDVKLATQNPATGEIAIALENNPVIIWDAEAQQIVREFADLHLQWESIAFSSDGRFLAGGTTDGTTVLYDAATGAALHTEVVESQALDLAFSPDSSELLISGRWILDTRSYALSELADTTGVCTGTGGTYVPDSDTLITGGTQICIWSASSHNLIRKSDENISGGLNAFEASPTGDSVVITTKYGPPDALVLNPDGTVRHRLTLTGGMGRLGQIDFATDGSFFVAMSGGTTLAGNDAIVVEPVTGQTLEQFDSSTFQSPTTYRIFSIYSGAVIEPDQLLLMHGTSGLSFIDLKEARAAAQTLQSQAKERAAQADVDQALQDAKQTQEQEEAAQQEAEKQAQAREAASQQALADARAVEAEKQALEKIFVAAREGSADELAKALGDAANNDLSVTDENGRTPLMVAAESNEPLTVRFLVNLGADVNLQTDQGWTALMYAAQDNTLEMVATLVELGADMSLTNAEGNSASDLAADDAVRAYLTQQSTSVQAPQAASENAATPSDTETEVEVTNDEKLLFELAKNGTDAEISDLLLRLSPETFGANPELLAKTNEDGLTPLMLAASTNDPMVVMTLGAQGQNYNQKTADGWTALMYAAKNGRLDNIEALSLWELNLLAVNNEGNTVFDVAAPDIREALKTRFSGAVRELQVRQAASDIPRRQPNGQPSTRRPNQNRQPQRSAVTEFASDLMDSVQVSASYPCSEILGTDFAVCGKYNYGFKSFATEVALFYAQSSDDVQVIGELWVDANGTRMTTFNVAGEIVRLGFQNDDVLLFWDNR